MLFMTMHNIFVMQSYSKFLNELASNTTFEQYYEAIKHQQKGYHAPETLLALRFLNTAHTQGLEKALRDYDGQIVKPIHAHVSHGLFGAIESKTTNKRKFLDDILDGYERYQKTGKPPEIIRAKPNVKPKKK